MCFNSKIFITLGKIAFIKKILSRYKMYKTSFPVLIKEIDDIQKLNYYIIVIIYIDKLIDNNITKKDILTIVIITRQVHLVDDLKIKIFIDNNIITSKRMLLDFDCQEFCINSCKDLRI